MQMLPIASLHLLLIGIFFTGVSTQSFIICFALLVLRLFLATAGYHRYFAHKSYKTSRTFQFILAFLAQTSFQKGVLWWANHHRLHHRYTDTGPEDPHSPKEGGFWHAHFLWMYTAKFQTKNYEMVDDFKRYPELVLLDKYHYIPGILLGLLILLLFGWQGFFAGFILSTIILYQITFSINSFCHILGKQRYNTGDASRNNWLLGLLAFGEGWHNNHHFYPASARQGFYWWEIDITYYGLKLLERIGLIWEVRTPSKKLINDPYYISKRAKNLSHSLITRTMEYHNLIQLCEESLTQEHEIHHYYDFLNKAHSKLEKLLHCTKKLPPKLHESQQSHIKNLMQRIHKILLFHDNHQNNFKELCKIFFDDLKNYDFNKNFDDSQANYQ